jgi:hypothetical protein
MSARRGKEEACPERSQGAVPMVSIRCGPAARGHGAHDLAERIKRIASRYKPFASV